MQAAATPRALLLSAYDAGSHRRWREQLVASQPQLHWQVVTLPPRHFRWRIRGNALSWLDEPRLLEDWDLIVATSMVDLAALKGIYPRLAITPALFYMHENQLAYPGSDRQHPSAEPAMVNVYGVLAADRVLFNSAWNRRSFLDGTREFLRRMPDCVPGGLARRVLDKSRILPVPVEDRLFISRQRPLNVKCPHLLWNHRWEYDKGPDRLLKLLDRLEVAGLDFRLSVVGEQFRGRPEVFGAIRRRHGSHLRHFGFVESRADYDRLLAAADVVISTARHDFQGLAMQEAMASGCVALAPDRLAYPEYVPSAQRYASFEDDPDREAAAAADRLMGMLEEGVEPAPPEGWRLSRLQHSYRRLLEQGIRADPLRRNTHG